MKLKSEVWAIGLGAVGIGLVWLGSLGTKTTSVNQNTNSKVIATVSPAQTQVVTPVNKEVKTVYTLRVPQEQVVVLAGEVGENAAGIATQITQKSSAGKPVFLLISSPGGSIMDGALIINAIEASPVPVYTVCVDLCASMAAMIHQYGTERLMFDRAVLMFHDAAGGFQGYFPHIKSQFEAVNRYVNRFNTYTAKRSGMTLEALELNEHTQLWVDSEDAITRKFTDKIVYIQVIQNKQPVDLKLLLAPTTKSKASTPNQTPFDFKITW